MGARVFLSFDYFLSNILKIFLVCNYGPFYWLTKSKQIEKTADLPQGLCYIKFYYIHVCTCTFRYGKSNLQGLPTLVVMRTYTLYIHYNPSPLLFYTWFIAVSRQVRLKQYFSYIFWLEQIYK